MPEQAVAIDAPDPAQRGKRSINMTSPDHRLRDRTMSRKLPRSASQSRHPTRQTVSGDLRQELLRLHLSGGGVHLPEVIEQNLLELGEARVALMDQCGISAQVVSLTTPGNDLIPSVSYQGGHETTIISARGATAAEMIVPWPHSPDGGGNGDRFRAYVSETT